MRMQLESFFDSLCEPAMEPRFGDPPTSIVPRQFRKKAFGLMFAFVQNHAQEIESELRQFPMTSSVEVRLALLFLFLLQALGSCADLKPCSLHGQESLARLKYLTQGEDHLDTASSTESESEDDGVR